MSTNPLTYAPPAAVEENPSRPKFGRRPASFSRPTAEVEEAAAPLPPPAPVRRAAKPAAPVSVPWQEDARFGVTMLVLVALFNLALMYGLRQLPRELDTSGPTEVAGKAPSMPQAVNRNEDNPVTLYAQPEEERRTLQQLNLNNHFEQGGQMLTTSPGDTPPPTARALGSEE